VKVKVIKFDNYKCPKREHHNDSGADCFSAIDITIPPYSVKAIPTGVGVCLPDGYDIVVHCKSGLSKRGIFAANAPVDSGYRGQIHAILYNTTSEPFTIEAGQKIGHFVMRPVLYPEVVEGFGKEREDGAFGSTGDR
jgi:dUTP pyrophosphatase